MKRVSLYDSEQLQWLLQAEKYMVCMRRAKELEKEGKSHLTVILNAAHKMRHDKTSKEIRRTLGPAFKRLRLTRTLYRIVKPA